MIRLTLPVPPSANSYIVLTQGQIARVDAEDMERFGGIRWQYSHGYAKRSVWRDGRKVTEYLHRLITAAPAGMQVDHINGDRLDNRRANLRVCSKAENQQNRGKQANSTTGFKGVTFDKRRGKYMAYIRDAGGVHRHLGYYDDPAEAARARDAAEAAVRGAFAHLNFPEAA